METVLSVKNLSISFRRYAEGASFSGGLSTALSVHDVQVISSLDIEIKAGELAAVIGSSGSGKSLLACALLGILPANAHVSGEILYRQKPLDRRLIETLRGDEIVLIPQSITNLDPLMKTGKQVAGTRHTESAVKKVFKRYGLPDSALKKYPHQLSGGMARRALICAAVLGNPRLIIADEPTPGLSSELADETARSLRNLADGGCAVMLITHDINLAVKTADSVSIFYAGTTVERALASDFSTPALLRHPYTKALWNALPQNGFAALPGGQPAAKDNASPCLFLPRCDMAGPLCQNAAAVEKGGRAPPLRELRSGLVRCFYAA
ncbi:MAG: ABC transporter ATP-binding protein [Spirochaetaceae bacterium]|jgi:peptide/nickel transport system ATP-binding protein|nr:ABC transporter ATP-binding protein [Spirochaetaceae bacterium]